MERPISESAIRDTIFKGLKKIAPEANPQDLAPDDNLREALDIDSFDFLNLLIGLHESLGVEIPEADYSKLTTLNGMVRYLSQRVG